MSDPFVHIHNHSCYSDGFGHPQAFVDRAKELGQTALAITDHGNVSAHKRWYDSCHEAGIKPLLGVEAYVVDDSTSKSQKGQWHITLLAKNLIGYRNLLKVVTLSWEHGFYYKPRTDFNILQQYSEGLIATSSCPSGKIGRGITREGWSDKQVVSEMKKQAGIFKDYYAEVSPWDYEDGRKVATGVYKAAVQEGVSLVLTMDCHYPRPEDAKIQDVMLCIQQQKKFDDQNRMKFSQHDFCLWSGEDMARKWAKIHGARLPGLDEMIINTGKIADMVDFKFPTGSLVSFPYDGDKVSLLRKMCEDGFKAKGFEGNQKYRERLEYEFKLIVDKGFVDYFLIVTDLVLWSKNRGILVGAARGSSCGSLACYLLRITEVDPIPYGLFFERFIDVSRSDLPDIDLDFEAERRDEVKKYMAEKYGQDRVASLATFGTFKGKMCLQDIGRVFDIPSQAIEETKRLIIQRSSADSRAGFTIEDTFTNFEQAAGWLKKYPALGMAKQLEGQIRQLGVHAAGMIISNEPIGNFAAVYVTSNKDHVLSMDYHDATSVGLMKIDVLGLTSLTAVKRTLASIKKNHGKDIDLLSIPLDDEEVYKNFCAGKLWGVFQFEGASTRQVCRQIQPKNFEDITAINALSRPGPLHSNSTTMFIERRFGRDNTSSLHPLIDDCVSGTHFLTIYQEQVMFIVRRMGKFTWEETSSIRRAMSRKLGDEFVAKMKEKFIQGAISQDVVREDAENVWKNIATHGCISGDSMVKVRHGRRFPIKTIYEKWQRSKIDWRAKQFIFKSMSFNNGDGTIENEILDVVKTGLKEVFEVVVKGKRRIKTTADHKFLTPLGWKKLSEIQAGDLVAVEKHEYKWKKKRTNSFYRGHTPNFFKSLKLRNRSQTNSARWDSSRIKISTGNKLYWDKHPEKKDNLILRIPEEKVGTFGTVCRAADGHICHSLNELKLEEWLIKNGLEHTPHPIVRTNGKTNRPRVADQLVKGHFIEMDGMSRTKEFWEEKYGVELPRVIIITPNESLDLKLGFLLDKKLSYIGSEKSLDNHLKIRWRMIQSIESKGVQETYDLCMKAPYNSFVANGFVVHNSWSFNKSHSVAYSIMAYHIMWLKTHYPSEFYAGFMSIEQDTEKQQRLLREHNSLFGKPLPVSVNNSEVGASSDKAGLRLGMDSVIGLGEKAIESIIKNRPYKNYVDFNRRSGLTKSRSEILLKIGAFRDMEFSHLSDQQDIFGADNSVGGVVDYKQPKEEDLVKYCPIMVENKACQEYREWLSGKIKSKCFKISELDDIITKTDVLIVGCSNPANNFNPKNKMEEAQSKGGTFSPKAGEEHLTKEGYNFLNFDTNDETDSIISRISYKLYPRFKSMIWDIKATDVLGIRGAILGEMRMVFAYNVVNLTRLRLKLTKGEKLTKDESEFLNPTPRKKWSRS